ncbi:MAG: hypothetical protein OXK21_11395 [Chloroflexota bacterium]|nr:hypothetical protein [Chloroflexota bacterium]
MSDSMPALIDLITAIGAIATPVLLLVFSGIGWYFKCRIESAWKKEAELRMRAERLEEAIRDDRLQVYNDILEPFIILFMKDGQVVTNKRQTIKTKEQRTLEIIQSLEYRKAVFKLSLFANDDVVKAYNNLMQFFYKMEKTSNSPEARAPEAVGRELLESFGTFLLAIRKSVGNEASNLNELDMLAGMISDIDKMRRQ